MTLDQDHPASSGREEHTLAIDDLPGPVVNLLNVLGIPWPYISESAVSEFAGLTRRFGQAVETTHQDGTKAVSGVAAAYRSTASDTMVSGWEKLSSRHVAEIQDGCEVLAAALDAAAGYILLQKGEAVAELIGMAAAFVGAQATAIETAGISEAAVPLIIKGAEKIVASLIADLQQYLLSRVVEAGLKPLMGKVEDALAGLDWSQSGADAAGRGTELELDAPGALTHAQALDQYATEMRGHAQTFAAGIRKLSF